VELFVGEKCSDKFRLRIRLPRNSRDLLHAANLRHGTDVFTSPPKEGVLKIFSPLKIRRLRSGLNPRTWVPKASTLPLDHRSRYSEYNYLIIEEKDIQYSTHINIIANTLILSSLLCLGLPMGLFPSVSPSQPCMQRRVVL